MSGTVNIARDLFDHGVFKAEPFTEREAWIWLIMQARWKPCAYRAGDFMVNLDRGQLAASVRFMAQAWGWTPARVQRYQKRLAKMEMICAKTDTGVTVITVCNYEKFQAPNQTGDTGPIQDRYRTDTEKKKDVIREEGKETEAKAYVAKKPVPSRFDEFWNVYPHRGGAKKGRKPSEASYARAVRAGASEQDIIDGAKRSAKDRQVVAGFARDPTTWLNQGGWEDEIDVSREGRTNGNGTHNAGRAAATGRDSFLDEITIAARSRPPQGGLGH